MTIEITEETKPFARFKGEVITSLPHDLYIPPEALEVFLEAFEGPLDLLLYLIKRQNLDILDIPVAKITAQYMQYVELMSVLNFELAAEYLLMAAMLAEIKSRMLLPRPESSNEDEDDPRAELVRRLQEYERFKKVAEEIDLLPRMERDFFPVYADSTDLKPPRPLPQVELKELLGALVQVLERAKLNTHHHVKKDALTLREKMSYVLNRVRSSEFTQFSDLFTIEEGRVGVVLTFIAVLELLRQAMIEMVQAEAFGPIHVKSI